MNHGLFLSIVVSCLALTGCGKTRKKESHYDKTLLALETGDTQQALSHLNKALAASPLPQYYALKGTLHYQRHEFKESEKIFKDLLNNKDLQPSLRAEVLNNYACVLNQIGKQLEAQMLWQQLTHNRNYPTPEVAWYNLGILAFEDSKKMAKCSVQQSQKLAKVAIKRFQQALTLEPDYVDAHFYLAQAYLLTSQHKGAQTALKKVLAISPDHLAAQQLLNSSTV